MARSLNKAQLIGNLTRDPELRFTPQGTAVCTFSVATNRQWKTESGEKKEDVEFHRIVAWNKLAELCAQLLTKGRKVYVEGRLQTRSWEGQDGAKRQTTEIVLSDMVILDSRRDIGGQDAGVGDVPADLGVSDVGDSFPEEKAPKKPAKPKKPAIKKAPSKKKKKEAEEDIPF